MAGLQIGTGLLDSLVRQQPKNDELESGGGLLPKMQRNGFKTLGWKRALQGIGMILLIAIALLSYRVYRLVNVTIPAPNAKILRYLQSQ